MGQRVGGGGGEEDPSNARLIRLFVCCRLSDGCELAWKICTDSHKSRFQSATVAKVQPGNSKMRREDSSLCLKTSSKMTFKNSISGDPSFRPTVPDSPPFHGVPLNLTSPCTADSWRPKRS
jgi:hypothetical protein